MPMWSDREEIKHCIIPKFLVVAILQLYSFDHSAATGLKDLAMKADGGNH